MEEVPVLLSGFRLRFFLFLLLGAKGADEDVGVAALQPGQALDQAVGGQVVRKAHEQLLSQIHVGDLASAELNVGLDPVAFFQKADGMVLFELVIVIVGVGTELEFLHLDDVLLLLGVVLLLFLLIRYMVPKVQEPFILEKESTSLPSFTAADRKKVYAREL